MLFEDTAYDPKKAVLGAQKLVNQDKIFAMVGHIGTAQNMAAMPVQFEKNVINFFPVTAAREMYEPFHRLKYSFAATYFDQGRVVEEKGPRASRNKLQTVTLLDAIAEAFGQFRKLQEKRIDLRLKRATPTDPEYPMFGDTPMMRETRRLVSVAEASAPEAPSARTDVTPWNAGPSPLGMTNGTQRLPKAFSMEETASSIAFSATLAGVG